MVLLQTRRLLQRDAAVTQTDHLRPVLLFVLRLRGLLQPTAATRTQIRLIRHQREGSLTIVLRPLRFRLRPDQSATFGIEVDGDPFGAKKRGQRNTPRPGSLQQLPKRGIVRNIHYAVVARRFGAGLMKNGASYLCSSLGAGSRFLTSPNWPGYTSTACDAAHAVEDVMSRRMTMLVA